MPPYFFTALGPALYAATASRLSGNVEKITQVAYARVDVLRRVERVVKIKVAPCFRHYLHESLGSGGRHGGGIEAGFDIDDRHDKLFVHAVFRA